MQKRMKSNFQLQHYFLLVGLPNYFNQKYSMKNNGYKLIERDILYQSFSYV